MQVRDSLGLTSLPSGVFTLQRSLFRIFNSQPPARTGSSARNPLPSMFPSLTPALPFHVSARITISGKPFLFSLKAPMLLTWQLHFYICLGLYFKNIRPSHKTLSFMKMRLFLNFFTNLLLCWMSEWMKEHQLLNQHMFFLYLRNLKNFSINLITFQIVIFFKAPFWIRTAVSTKICYD